MKKVRFNRARTPTAGVKTMNGFGVAAAFFYLAIAAMTVFFNYKNFKLRPIPCKVHVLLSTGHFITLLGLLGLVASTLGMQDTEVTQAKPGSEAYWFGYVTFFVGVLFKRYLVPKLPDDVWQLPGPLAAINRNLLLHGRAQEFHLINDIAAFVPIILLVLIARVG